VFLPAGKAVGWGYIKALILFFCITGDLPMKTIIRFASAFFVALAFLIVVSCASTSNQVGTGEYIDDAVLTTKVKAAIFNDPSLKSAEINVETFRGEVQLSGFVNSRADINKAVEVARDVIGVQSVKNDMRLK
jgi:BON domain